MDFEILSFVGAGPIKFGMTQQEVRAVLNGDVVSFKRTPMAAWPCDHYEGFGVFVYYKAPGHVEAVEFYEPSNPTFSGVSLLKESAERVKSLLLSMDPNVQADGTGFVSHAMGVGVYAPDAEDDASATIESVIAFEKGYYG